MPTHSTYAPQSTHHEAEAAELKPAYDASSEVKQAKLDDGPASPLSAASPTPASPLSAISSLVDAQIKDPDDTRQQDAHPSRPGSPAPIEHSIPHDSPTVPTLGHAPGSRYQELFLAKMAAEQSVGGSGDGSGNSSASITMDTRQTSQSSNGRPASHDEQWARAIGSQGMQEADRMRQGQTVMNSSFVGMGNGGPYGQASGSGSGQHGRKPSTSGSVNGSEMGSPRIGPMQGGQQQGWNMQQQGQGASRARQVSGDGSYQSTPPQASPHQPMSAPPSQTTFDYSHSQAAFANQSGAQIPATVPAYRPQSQQSAYFQRMMAAKLAADPNMRSEQQAQQNASFAQPWTSSGGDASDAGSTSTASGLGNGMQQFLPSTNSPMFHMVNTGSSEHGQAPGNGSNQSLSSAGSHGNLASPAMGGQGQLAMGGYGQQPGGSRPVGYSPQSQYDPNSQSQTPSMAYTAGWAGQNQFYNQPKRESNGGMGGMPPPDSARFGMGPPMTGYPGQPMAPHQAPFGGMRMASSSTGGDQGGMPLRSEGSSQRGEGDSIANNGEGSGSQGPGDNSQTNGSGHGGNGGDGEKGSGGDKDTPKKAVLACHFCRGRKLKCDGQRPSCSHCVRRNLSCSYDAVIRRRGPGKKKKNQDPNASIDSAGGGGEDGDGSAKKPEGKKRGRKPKDPNAPPKNAAQMQMQPQPFGPPGFHGPPHTAYAYGAMPPGMEGPPMHYPMHHPYATMHYGPPPGAFHMGPESYIDPALQGDRRMEFAPGPPPGMDHRYDYAGYGYMPRPAPPPTEDEHLSKRARYEGGSSMVNE